MSEPKPPALIGLFTGLRITTVFQSPSEVCVGISADLSGGSVTADAETVSCGVADAETEGPCTSSGTRAREQMCVQSWMDAGAEAETIWLTHRTATLDGKYAFLEVVIDPPSLPSVNTSAKPKSARGRGFGHVKPSFRVATLAPARHACPSHSLN